MITRLSPADFGRAMARGLAQILLQRNTITGLLIFVGIVLHSLSAGLGALVGLLCSTGAAMVAGYDRTAVASGLYGYNGALVGLALFSFFEFQVILFAAAAVGSALSTVIYAAMRRRGIAAYTFPFVITTWILVAMLRVFPLVSGQSSDLGSEFGAPLLVGIANGVGQVMFQPYVITGILFVVALYLSSKTGAAFAVAGSAIGGVLGYALKIPPETLATGLFGFNAVLCGIAFAGTRLRTALLALSAMILATALYGVFALLGLPALTFPFVAATWLIKYLNDRLVGRHE
jgi:urea transporter